MGGLVNFCRLAGRVTGQTSEISQRTMFTMCVIIILKMLVQKFTYQEIRGVIIKKKVAKTQED